MRLTCRTVQTSDLEACLALTRDSGAPAGGFGDQYHSFLESLLENGSWISAMVEDHGEEAGKRVVGFAASVFIPDGFAHQIKAGLRTDLSLVLLEKWRLGLKPCLCPEAIRKANSEGGLTVLALHFNHVEGRCAPQEQSLVTKCLTEQFRASHEGYRVKEWLVEVREIKNRNLALNMGFHPYRAWAETAPQYPNPIEAGRHLLGFQTGVSPERPGTILYSLSLYTPPRFYFSPIEQEVLREALQNATDEEIGPSAGISHWAVKKRWQGIYRKVAGLDPELMITGPDLADLEPARVKQKRRRLLNYLRVHPEELRPLPLAREVKKISSCPGMEPLVTPKEEVV